MKTWDEWLENKMRTAMSGAYPDSYGAAQYPPLAVTPISSSAARAYTNQYKHLLKNLRGAKKKKKGKKKD
jgi:hypothetical protein